MDIYQKLYPDREMSTELIEQRPKVVQELKRLEVFIAINFKLKI